MIYRLSKSIAISRDDPRRQPHSPPLPPRLDRCDEASADSRSSHHLPDRLTVNTRADEGDDGHAHDLPGDDEPDADPREGRQPRHDRSPRRLAETPGGSGDAGLAGGAAGECGEVAIKRL